MMYIRSRMACLDGLHCGFRMVFVIAAAGAFQPAGSADLVRSMMGINMAFYAEWGPGQVVVDLMKQARPFGTPQRWWDYGTAPHDENGWPTGDAGTIFAMSEQAGVIQLGTYKLSFSGTARVASVDGKVTVANRIYDAALGVTTADVVAGSGAGTIGLLFTETNGGVRNVKLIRPGYKESDLVTEEFVNAIRPFSVLRMLNWTGDAQYAAPWVTEWSDERHNDYATFCGGETSVAKKPGVSKEFQIAVANKTMKDIWIHLPLFCSDDYVRNLATLVRDSLNPNLRLYFEICNELWNWAYPYGTATGAHKNAALAEAAQYGYAFDGDNDEWHTIPSRRVARRVVEHAKIFAEVLGSDQVPSRVRPVLAWQAGSGAYEAMLSYIVNRYGADAPARYIYAVSSAPYFGGNDFATMQNSSTTINPVINLKIITTAKKYGVQAIAYEGGPHIASPGGQTPEMHASQTMGDLIYSDLKNNWFDQGGGLFCYYMLTGVWVNGHLWGATQNLAELDGPKYQALVRLADELPKENDQPVEDGTERNLWLVGVTGDHNNNRYKCTITNADGSVTSNTVTLHVTGGVTGTTAALPSKANAGRLTVSGSVAAIGLAGPQQWTMELRGLDGALVRRATGFGAEASVRLPAARTAFVAQVTTGGRTVARGLVTAR